MQVEQAHTHRCLGEGRQVPAESGAHLTRRWRMRSGEHSVRPLGTGFIAVFGYSSKLKSKQAANKVKLQPARRRRNRSRSRSRSFSQFASLVCCVLPASFFYLLPARHFNLNLKFSGSTRLVAIRFDSIRFFVRALDNPRVASSHSAQAKAKANGKAKGHGKSLRLSQHFWFLTYTYDFVFVFVSVLVRICIYFFVNVCVCVCPPVFVFVFVFVLNAIKYPSGMQHFS